MRHLFALDLQLEIGLFLRAHVDSNADEFQKISVFVLETSPAHNDPSRLAVGQNETVLRLEDAEGRAGMIERRVNPGALVGMDAAANQVAVQRLVGIESINGAPFMDSI